MSDQIKSMRVLNINGKNIFSDKSLSYVIPLYQRAFAWEDTEIKQLIEDITDFKENIYYIGSLIVSKNENNNSYEVIDGQQRMTALFLLLSALGEKVENILTFACRIKSDKTLKNINQLELLNIEDIEESLQKGKKVIDSIVNGRGFKKKQFLSQLRKVKLYRIEVPPNTDLNRYFEIMNTRGEQLEQHDILKASLMGAIKDDDSKALFAKIWDACSDMTGYVQMHFDTTTRKEIFGYDLRFMPAVSFRRKNDRGPSEGFDIKSIIRPTFRASNIDAVTNKGERVRFESITTFPFFLLHALKVFVADMDIVHSNQGETLVYELLDDKKLTETFNRVITQGKIRNQPIAEMEEAFAINFVKCLLKCRFLFDKYIIKREFVSENSIGEWSLQQLEVSGRDSNKKAYFINTNFGQSGEWSETRKLRHEKLLMLQACLRVSYTSPKVMHWITELLKWLYINDSENLAELNQYEWKTEGIAANAVKTNYLDPNRDGFFDWGTDTPHIVFNYLDYLLWKDDPKQHSSFVFEFRNSVEHWYPRNPSEGTFERWSHEDGVDDFGNLCLIQRDINSRFSNMAPEAKKSTFSDMIAKGSLKLKTMAEMTIASGGKNASQNWKDELCAIHEGEMLERLVVSCSSV